MRKAFLIPAVCCLLSNIPAQWPGVCFVSAEPSAIGREPSDVRELVVAR